MAPWMLAALGTMVAEVNLPHWGEGGQQGTVDQGAEL